MQGPEHERENLRLGLMLFGLFLLLFGLTAVIAVVYLELAG